MMTDKELNTVCKRVLKAARVEDADVRDIRRLVFEDGRISVHEADLLFQINHLPGKPDSWDTLFVEAITHFLVRQTLPYGYIDAANTAWLKARIDHDGVVETNTELELLLYILEQAKSAPEDLESYALDQVIKAVVIGRGHVAHGRTLKPGVIGKAEVDLLRRILYANSGEGGVGISRHEAEKLFDLNDALEGADNDESWQFLFVRAIANHLMVQAAWEAPDREEALRRENWLEQKEGHFVVPSFKGFGAAFKSMFKADEMPTYSILDESKTRAAEKLTGTEADWLIERLNRDGFLSENEKALLAFLKAECPEIHESLMPYIQAA